MKRPAFTDDSRYAFSRLGGIAWAGLATTIYAAIGVVTDRAGGMAPLSMLLVGVFVGLTALSYTELMGLRDAQGKRLAETPGATGYARLAFDELVAFVAAWAVILDLLLLTAIGAEAFSGYLLAIVPSLSDNAGLITLAGVGVIVAVGIRNARAPNLAKGIGIRLLLAADAVVLAFVGGALLIEALRQGMPLLEFDGSIGLRGVIFGATIGVVAVTGFETAASLAAETRLPRARQRRFLLGLAVGSLLSLLLAGALAGSHRADLQDPDHVTAPIAYLAAALEPQWFGDIARLAVAILAATTLAVATNGAMLAVARLSSTMATTRQLPSRIGRLNPKYGTPTTVIALVVVLTSVMVILLQLETLIGLYAYGALLALTIVHGSVIKLRFSQPSARRSYRIGLSIPVGKGSVPLPALIGLVMAVCGWVAVLLLHRLAPLTGTLWMVGGVVLHIVHRRVSKLPLRKAVVVPKTVLSRDTEHGEFGSILVPIFGRPLDDDIVQTAGRLARDRALDVEESGGAQIEAIWVFEMPMSVPLASAVSDERLKKARAALARAKAVGEEYEGVAVATATVRARRVGQGIVDEAKRRGVEVIVMAAEDPSGVRGGSVLGGVGDFSGRSIGPTTAYVLGHAPCRVLLTAPPFGDRGVSALDPEPVERR